MKEESKVLFYQINRCGYYKRKKNLPQFGHISEVLKDLHVWVKRDSRPLVETCPFEIEESASTMRTFCFDIQEHSESGDFLVTTWNETPNTQGKVAAVEANKPVGSASVIFSDLKKGTVPGFATYFWFLPKKGVFATVRFHHALNGHQSLARYLREFIAKCSSFTVRREDEDSGETRIIGYRKPPALDIFTLSPQFYSSVFRKTGHLEFLKKNREKIRKIVRKNSLTFAIPEELQYWQKLLKFLGIRNPEPRDEEIRVKQEIEIRPTENELQEIVENWEKEHESKWDDVGFTLSGDPNIQWLSHAFAKDVIELDVERQNEEVIEASSLLGALIVNREYLLTLLSDEDPD